jgi:phosphoenolpyruvate carboxykinase (GTP)
MADYFGHWLAMGSRASNPPSIFHVNWFQTDEKGNFLWPGFGENIRVLRWILERVRGQGKGVETPIGFIPTPDALELDGLKLPPGTMEELLRIDRDAWSREAQEQALFFGQFGERLPAAIWQEHKSLSQRLNHVSTAVSPVETPRSR